jgi:ABC-2 type transport system ATP-binding protein
MQREAETQETTRVVSDRALSDTQPRRPVSKGAGADGLIVAQGLTKAFNDEDAVKEVSFTIPAGLIFGFIGPSGSGKTTTIRLLTGMYRPTAGTVSVFGENPQNFSPATRGKIGYMPQQFVLYPNLSVWENMTFSASLYGLGLGRGKRIKQQLDFVELYEHRNKLARSISGGMQRRLALAATLTHDPSLIFLDEPTAGIDPVLRQKFWDYFRSLRDQGHTLFITTQYVGEAAYCDLVGVMAEGRLLMVETPDGLRHRAFGGDMIDVRGSAPFDYRTVAQVRQLPFISGPVQVVGDRTLRLVVDDAGTAVPDLVEWANANSVELVATEKYEPPLDDVFVELVKREQPNA